VIITKDSPFSKEEIDKLSEEFETYIKTVIDIEKEICSAGASRHFESEQILLSQGSKQNSLWGGGIDLETKEIDFNSFINIRPQNGNTSNEIQDAKIKEKYKKLTEYFFNEVL
jgi:hypothetical protein